MAGKGERQPDSEDFCPQIPGEGFEEIYDPNEQIFSCGTDRFQVLSSKVCSFVRKVEYSIIEGTDFNIVDSDQKLNKHV